MKKFLKDNYKFLLFVLFLALFFNLKLPYYIMAPGGTINITDRVELEGYQNKEGSLNMLYVSEYKATPSLCLYSLFKGYDIEKVDNRKLYKESVSEIEKRNKIMRDNSLGIALMVAYTKAGKYINIKSKKNIVLATTANNGLKVGDIILRADNIECEDVEDIKDIIKAKEENEIVKFKVIRGNKEITVNSKVLLENNQKVIGVVIITDYEYEKSPELNLKFKDSESGSSGGLMLTLTIYNAITNVDIIKGRNIAGTGTIMADGTVGEIDGVKYKIMGAAKENIDLVFVPSSNYQQAIETKNKYNYNMEIIKVDTFDEVLEYLQSK